MSAWVFAGVLLLSVSAYLLLSGFLLTWRKYRGTRLITCPENFEAAAVHVNAWRAAQWAAIAGEAEVRLNRCSRWPERAGCGQHCLEQIEVAPEACLVGSIVSSWYDGKRCAYCDEEIGPVVWHDRPPALRTPDGTTREWKSVQAEELPALFRWSKAVCWRCHVTESFRRNHAELVVERHALTPLRHTIAPSATVY